MRSWQSQARRVMTSLSSPRDSLSTGVFSDWHSQAAGQQMIGRKRIEDSGRENCPVLELNQEFCFFYTAKTTSPSWAGDSCTLLEVS